MLQVGGEISSTIMGYMNHYGRVAVCGSISSYNDASLPKGRIRNFHCKIVIFSNEP